MQMLLAAPPIDLSHHIITLWALRGVSGQQNAGLPKPYVEMIVSLNGVHDWSETTDSHAKVYKVGWVTPVQSAPRYAKTMGEMHLIGARLHLETAGLLFGPDVFMSGCTPLPLDDLLGKEFEILRERLAILANDQMRMVALGAWIRSRLREANGLSQRMPLNFVNSEWRVDELSAHIGLSARGLRKRFHSRFGFGPKFWLQLQRFERLLQTGELESDLASAAAMSGYADQAHMTREFRRFSGQSPTQYLRSRHSIQAPTDAPHFAR